MPIPFLRNAVRRMCAPIGLLLACLTAPLGAQQVQPQSHTVRGVVYDSVARAPLAGAEVRVDRRDGTGTPYRALSDGDGRFSIAGVPSGQYVVSFSHEALDLLGLDAPSLAMKLSKDSLVGIALGIPSSGVVRSRRCGSAGPDSTANALLAGFVGTGAGHQPLAGATVAVSWEARKVRKGNARQESEAATDTVAADGSFSLCGVPSGTVLGFDVRAAGYRDISGPVTIPDDGVLRQDALLVDTTALRGQAEVRGRVVSEAGRPIMSGRARIPALSKDVAIVDGAFIVTDLPVGTWVMELRAIGVEPRSMVVQASARRDATLMVRVSEQARRLDAVTIVGRPDRIVRVLDDIMKRQRTASGTVFLPGNPHLRDAMRITDVLVGARGFNVLGPKEVVGRVMGLGQRCRNISVYVNGVRAVEGLDALDDYARPNEVLAIEAYPDVLSAPFQWRSMDGVCAVVALWTKK